MLLLPLLLLLLFLFLDGDSFLRGGGAASAGRVCRSSFPLVGALELQGLLRRGGPLRNRDTVCLLRVLLF